MNDPQSADDLRSLVHDLRPRSPQEVMGEAASSSLVGSTVTAAVAGIGLVIGSTVLVFLLGGRPRPVEQPVATAAPTQAEPQPVADDDLPASAADDSTTEEPFEGGDPESAIEAMGIGEAKDPQSEPESLENRLDKILDGLE